MNASTNIDYVTTEIDGVYYIKNMLISITGYVISVRMLDLENSSTNCTYTVWIARDFAENGLPVIIRDWTMTGFHQPRDHANSLKHRAKYGATNYIMGTIIPEFASANMIGAIFDSLLGTCHTKNTDEITEYVLVADAMYRAGLVSHINDRYSASVITPIVNLTGTRVWRLDPDGFKFVNTSWVFSIDRQNRLTHRDEALGTTAARVIEIMQHKATALSSMLADIKL